MRCDEFLENRNSSNQAVPLEHTLHGISGVKISPTSLNGANKPRGVINKEQLAINKILERSPKH